MSTFKDISAQRLIFHGSILTPDSKCLNEYANLTSGCAIHLTRIAIPSPPGNEDTLEARSQYQNNPTYIALNNARILQRNFSECVFTTQTNRSPEVRQRYTDVESPTPGVPVVADLGYLTNEMAFSLLTWSHQLERMGHQFGVCYFSY